MGRRTALITIICLSILILGAAPSRAQAQQCPNNFIAAPASGGVARGSVEIIGSAGIDRFQFYKVEFAPSGSGRWSAVSSVIRRPVQNARLDTWNTRVVPDGLYDLRLIVVDERGQEVCQSLVSRLQVANTQPVASPTPTNTPTPLASPTPSPSPTLVASATSISLPTAAAPPTIPPLPTGAQPVAQVQAQATPAATARPNGTGTPGGTARPAGTPTPSRGSSLLPMPDLSGIRQAASSAFQVSRLRDAFLLGAIGTLAIFAFIGVVYLLRRLL